MSPKFRIDPTNLSKVSYGYFILDFFLVYLAQISGPAQLLPPFFFNYKSHAAAADQLLQSCPTLCDPIDGSP